MSQPYQVPQNPYASPQTGPEDLDPVLTNDVPPMPEVHRGVTLVYAGFVLQIVMGMVIGAIGGAMGAASARSGQPPNTAMLEVISVALFFIPAAMLMYGVWLWSRTPEEVSGRNLVWFVLGCFFMNFLSAIPPQINAVGPTGEAAVAAIGTIFNGLGWGAAALFLRKLAQYMGNQRLAGIARNVAIFTGINLIAGPPMIFAVVQFGQAAQQGPAATPPPTGGMLAAMAIGGILSLIWLVLNARLYHYMRKAIPAA